MKTRNRAHPVSSYSFQKGERILIDTNIWLFLFPAPSSFTRKQTQRYSHAFAKLLREGAQPVIDALVLSEYINRYQRIEYGAAKGGSESFKNFRNSKAFLPVGQALERIVREITSNAELVDTPSTCLNLKSILPVMAQGLSDFNDLLLLHTCQTFQLKLLTDDGDMTVGGVDVLTANARLLAACPPIDAA